MFLSFPSWDSLPILGEPRAESTPQRENICAFQRCQREFSYAIHLIRVSTTTNARPNFGQAISYASPLKVGVMSYMKPQQGNRLVIQVMKCSHGLNPSHYSCPSVIDTEFRNCEETNRDGYAGSPATRTRNMTGTGLNCLPRFLQVQDGVWSAG